MELSFVIVVVLTSFLTVYCITTHCVTQQDTNQETHGGQWLEPSYNPIIRANVEHNAIICDL